jgi:peptide/nickel transport system substrate-binding protein
MFIGLSCQAVSPRASPVNANWIGGTLRVGVVHFWEAYLIGEAPGAIFDLGLDPHQPIGMQAELFRCCLVRTLLSYSGQPTDGGGTRLRADLATGLPVVSDDGLTWTFHLKEGLRYGPPLQDTEIVAGDIVRAIERELTPTPPDLAALPFAAPRVGAGYYIFESLVVGARAFLEGTASSIAGLEAPDRHTLVVHTTTATGDIPYLFALSESAPIPPNPTDPLARLGVAEGHDGGYGPYLVSSGPYMLEGADALDFSVPADQQRPAAGYRSGVSFSFVRNPSWDRSTDDLRPAYLDRIDFSLQESEEAALAAVEAGALDLAWDVIPPHDQVATFANDPALRSRLISEPNDVVFLVVMNVAIRPLDDIHVRRALNLVVDKARIQALSASAPPRFAGPTGGRVATHVAPDGLESDLLVGYRPYDAANDRGDMAAARAEMTQSAYDTNRDGVCDAPECEGILALVRDDEPFWAGMSATVAEGAAELGIVFDRQVVSVHDMFARGLDPSAKVPITFGIRFNKDYPTAAGFIPGLFAGEALTPGGGNSSLLGATPEQLAEWGYAVTSVPSIDDRIDACRAEIREPVECWARLDQYLMEQVGPALPLLSGEAAWIVSQRVAETGFAQATIWPALDRFVIAPEAR